jgi:hypothetical protein
MSFTDFIQLQNDVAHALASDSFLANVNIVTRERLLIDSSRLPDQTRKAEVLAYMTPRNNKFGCGVIVEKPELVAPFRTCRAARRFGDRVSRAGRPVEEFGPGKRDRPGG